MILSFLAVFAFYAPVFPVEIRQTSLVVPEYVTKYAPIVYLHSSNRYLPSDIASQVLQTQPKLNYTIVTGAPNPLTLDNLNELNDLGGEHTYLTSKTSVDGNVSWPLGQMPDSNGSTGDAVSCAVIVRDHGDGTVDAFYMYFYAFNPGKFVLDQTIGSHVGDWEHNMIRFKDGEPQAIWYSQHSNGQAFYYDTVEKYTNGLRASYQAFVDTRAD